MLYCSKRRGRFFITAPLLLSLDLTQPVAPALLAVALNSEVLAVSQDAAQAQGVRVSVAAPVGTECWARPLAPRAGQRQLEGFRRLPLEDGDPLPVQLGKPRAALERWRGWLRMVLD